MTCQASITGKERDQESGLDYFGARYYSSNMGRFMSPDWSAQATPVPYAKLDSPQTLNLYSYAENNPLSQADADGHFATPWHFLITFVAALATGQDLAHAFIYGVKSAAVDFQKGSQSGAPNSVHKHYMAAAGESRAQAVAGGDQMISSEEANGDIGGDQHTRGDRHALGHGPDNVWDPAPSGWGKFTGGLSTWDLIKHEFGDWLPSPWALWGALRDQMDGFRITNPPTNSSPSPVSPGGGASGMNCMGCAPPPQYFPPPAPQPPSIKPDQVHTVSQ